MQLKTIASSVLFEYSAASPAEQMGSLDGGTPIPAKHFPLASIPIVSAQVKQSLEPASAAQAVTHSADPFPPSTFPKHPKHDGVRPAAKQVETSVAFATQVNTGTKSAAESAKIVMSAKVHIEL
jgi:hypothetical protein